MITKVDAGRRRTTRLAVGLLLTVLALAGCGSSGSHSPTPRHATPAVGTSGAAGTTPAGTSGAAGTSGTAGTTPATASTLPAGIAAATDPAAAPATQARPSTIVPTGAVATVAGAPITEATFTHWLTIAARSNSKSAHARVIVPDYPSFTHCIATGHSFTQFAHASHARLLAACKQLFKALYPQVMDYLIRSVWFEQAAASDGIAASPATLAAQFTLQRQKEFKTAAAYRTFLATSGETVADLQFRVRVDYYYQALVKRAGSTTKLQTQLIAQLKPLTECAVAYAMSDCAN